MQSATSCPEPLEAVVRGLRTWQLGDGQRNQAGLGLHVWLVAWPNEPPGSDRKAWWELLDKSERVRCAGIGTENGQTRFIASHAAAKVLVPGPQAWRDGRASLSHTARLAAVASADVPVGIDIEADIPRPRWSAADRQQWPGSPASNWSEFVARWVSRESMFKCGVAGDGGSPVLSRVRGLAGVPDHILGVMLGHPG